MQTGAGAVAASGDGPHPLAGLHPVPFAHRGPYRLVRRTQGRAAGPRQLDGHHSAPGDLSREGHLPACGGPYRLPRPGRQVHSTVTGGPRLRRRIPAARHQGPQRPTGPCHRPGSAAGSSRTRRREEKGGCGRLIRRGRSSGRGRIRARDRRPVGAPVREPAREHARDRPRDHPREPRHQDQSPRPRRPAWAFHRTPVARRARPVVGSALPHAETLTHIPDRLGSWARSVGNP